MIPANKPGRRVRRLDRYELVAELAKGGMGRVYLGRLRGFGGFERLLAIKLMHPHLAEESQFVSMLLDEARLAAKLHHPNAVAITEVCATDAGHYLVMEYVDGFTLSQVLKRKALEPRDRIRIGLRILLDAAAGLDAAHVLKEHDGTPIGLVHRDVSPQNIMVGVDGVGRITDFGIAKAAARITSSRPGTIKGKMRYMAPEQAMGKAVDARADLFCLGIILWEIFAGESLFFDPEGDAATLVKVVQSDIPPPRSKNPLVTPQLDYVCMKALDRDVGKRFQSARELIDALETAARKCGLLARTHEVADKINELFEEKITARRQAIQRHLEAIEATNARVSSDVFSVPELVRPSDPEFIPTSSAEIHILTGAESMTRKKARAGVRTHLLVGGVITVLAAGLLIGLGPFTDGDEEETVEDDVVITDDEPEPSPVAPTDPEPSEVAEIDEPEPALEETSDPPEGEVPIAAAVTEPNDEHVGSPVRASMRSMRTPMGMRSAGSAMTQDQVAEPASGGLELEDNPYLRR